MSLISEIPPCSCRNHTVLYTAKSDIVTFPGSPGDYSYHSTCTIVVLSFRDVALHCSFSTLVEVNVSFSSIAPLVTVGISTHQKDQSSLRVAYHSLSNARQMLEIIIAGTSACSYIVLFMTPSSVTLPCELTHVQCSGRDEECLQYSVVTVATGYLMLCILKYIVVHIILNLCLL